LIPSAASKGAAAIEFGEAIDPGNDLTGVELAARISAIFS
jgi:hypothetical protein